MSDIPILKALNAVLAEARTKYSNGEEKEKENEEEEGEIHGNLADIEDDRVVRDINQNEKRKKSHDEINSLKAEIYKNKEELSHLNAEIDEQKNAIENINAEIDQLHIDLEGGSEGEEEKEDEHDVRDDPVFRQIQETVARNKEKRDSVISMTSTTSSVNSDGGHAVKTSTNFNSVPYGFIPKAVYEHSKKNTDIMGVTYNGKMKQFVIVDAKGITTWSPEAINVSVSRAHNYPKYEYRLVTHLVYAKKHNVYFALWKDFSLKVLNKDFEAACSVSASLRSVLFMLFNPVRDELITGGVGGTKVWKFHQVVQKSFTELKAMANYRLSPKYELPNVGGSWVKRVELDQYLQHLYCCSDTDLHAYDLQGTLLFQFNNAHSMSITGCAFSLHSRLLITCSMDTEVKVWSITGGLVHTFRGHSKAVTNLVLHPETSSIVVTSSLDGSVRLWSLDTMDILYSIVISSDGVLWMGITEDKSLYASTVRNISVWNLNYVCTFWGVARNRLMSLQLYPSEKKSTRVVSEGDDSSIRIFNRGSRKNLSIVLPPPPISPLQQIKHVTYCREINVMYVLINPKEIWLYTTRTDPACRMAVWDVHDIQESLLLGNEPEEDVEEIEKEKVKEEKKKTKGKAGKDEKEEKEEAKKNAQENTAMPKLRKNVSKNIPNHRATEHGIGTETITDVNCVCALDSIAIMWSEDGMVCPLTQQYLLMGLEDGRILFMDPMVKAKKYFQFRANKDPIVDIKHNISHNTILTRCSQKGADTIQIWSLPDLILQNEVYCAPHLVKYARLTKTLLCGYSDGVLEFNELVLMDDPGPMRASVIAKPEDLVADMTHKRCNTEHKEPIVAIDACTAKSLFCTMSSDGAIKLWEELGYALLMEIMLNDTLCGGCFLNSRGDLLLGFQNHLFSIALNKVYPGLRYDEDEDEEEDDADSDIFEDPYVVYEGIPSNEDLLTMDRYLVPFKMNFSRDFLEGNMKQATAKLEGGPLLSDSETDVSMAPTDTYMSPHDTPRNLSLIDLTLAAEVSKYDLLEKDLSEAGLIRAIQSSQSIKSRVMTKKDKLKLKMLEKKAKALETPTLGPESEGEVAEEDNERIIKKSAKKKNVSRRKLRRRGITGMSDEEDKPEFRYDLPHFGESPGPTPTPSPPSTPNTPSHLSVSEGGESTEEEVEVVEKPKAVAAQPVTKKTTTKAPVQDIMKQKLVNTVEEKRVDMSKVKIDTKSLFANKRVVMTQKKEADHGHQKSGGSVLDSELSKPKREVVKKQMRSDRKKPAKKTVMESDDSDEEEPPPRRPPIKKKAAAKPAKKVAQPKVEESPRDPEPTKPEKSRGFEKSTVSLEVGPRKFGAGAGAGASSSGKAPPLPKPKTPLEYNSNKKAGKSESGIGEDELTDAAGLAEETGGQQVPESGLVEDEGQMDDGQRNEADDLDRVTSAKSSRSKKSGSSSAKSLKFGIDATLDFDSGRPHSNTTSTVFRDSDYESVMTDLDLDLELTNQQPVTHITFQMKDKYTKIDSRPKSVQWHDELSEQYNNENGGDMEGLERSTLTSPDPSRRSITPGDGFFSDTDSIRDGQMSLDTMSILDRGSLLPVDSVSMRSFLLSPGDKLMAGTDDLRSTIMTPGTLTDTVTDVTRPLRPHTAGVYYRDYSEHGDDVQDLESTYMDALRRYQSSPSVSPLDKLYKNEGTTFEDNWQERAIERHLLLKMQRQLRSQSAAERRQLLELRQRQKRKALLGHHNCDQPYMNGQNRKSRAAEVAMHLFHVERANTPVTSARMADRTMSAPPGQGRGQGAGQGGQQQVPPQTPKAAFVQPVDKAELSAERPFRVRMSNEVPQLPVQPTRTKDVQFDVRAKSAHHGSSRGQHHGSSIHLRPQSTTRSIPSKCSRYILISNPKRRSPYTAPTPLEEQLLKQRFPEQSKRILKKPSRDRDRIHHTHLTQYTSLPLHF